MYMCTVTVSQTRCRIAHALRLLSLYVERSVYCMRIHALIQYIQLQNAYTWNGKCTHITVIVSHSLTVYLLRLYKESMRYCTPWRLDDPFEFVACNVPKKNWKKIFTVYINTCTSIIAFFSLSFSLPPFTYFTVWLLTKWW